MKTELFNSRNLFFPFKELVLLFILLITINKGKAQTSDSIPDAAPETYRLTLDFPLADFPYINDAAQSEANRRLNPLPGNNAPVQTTDYAKAYFSRYNNLSMRQLTAMAENLHGTNYYINNLLWNKWVKPTNKRRRVLNRVLANITAGVPDFLMSYYLPFGNGYAHEEFHRNVLTVNNIPSYDEFWSFNNGQQITHVRDEDLVYFKEKQPADFVRLHTAGIEGQYAFLRNMQKQNFFYDTKYPNVAINVLLTKYIIDYVNQTDASDYNSTMRKVFSGEPTIEERDINGDDFLTYTYELFRPNQPYTARGIAPNGVGIARYLTTDQLTTEEFDYLKKMGRLQYLNFLSPHLIGINQIRISENFKFNFAVRHLLTSFGYEIGGDVFLKLKEKNILLGFHGYRNKNNFFPGIEGSLINHPVAIGTKKLRTNTTVMLWTQPENQGFFTSKAQPGGLLAMQLRYPVSKSFQPYLEVEGKTKGWVANNPYLKSSISARAGFSIMIK
jgi:hypothetical protein